jgi:hypothetical protein
VKQTETFADAISTEERRKLTSKASPVVLRYKGRHGPATGIAIAGLVALLILSLWLHFILAQKIEFAGRESQVKTAELHRIERHNHELRHKISIVGSQERMAERSRALGYAAQQPIYLLADQPLPPATQSSRPTGGDLDGTAEDRAQAAVLQPASGPVTGSDNGE